MNAGITLLKQVMNGSALRHRALASNIANVNTPDYQRRDVSFLKELKTALTSGKPDAVAEWRPSTETETQSGSIRLETEFAALSDNQLLYVTSADLLTRKYARLKSAIKG